MALAFYFAPTTPMSAEQYNECIARLKKAGAGHPRGRVYHAAFGPSDGLAVFDVWTSQAEFEAFGQTLMPILQALNVNSGQPQVMPVHNVIVPPAARPKAAAPNRGKSKSKAKAPAKKRASPKAAAKAKKKGKKR